MNELAERYLKETLRKGENIEVAAKAWRDGELKLTDWIVPITDHPERAGYLTYRASLRDWPTTDDFPNIKPTL